MSARMQTEATDWSAAEAIEQETAVRELRKMQVERLFRNSEKSNLVAPLREAQGALAREDWPEEVADEKRLAALALQEQWDAWAIQRDRLRSEIKRGRECLETVQNEVVALRTHLEEWPAYERICGQNPLPEYMQSLAARERIEQFLPGWLKRREEQLQALACKMEQCARQNGVEHLL